jgi:hypothetical protein
VRSLAPAPSDEALLAALRPQFDRDVVSMQRRPYGYATSSPLEELTLELADGERVSCLFKDLAWERLLDGARRAKPTRYHDPRREVETYRHILAPEGIGPRCHLAVSDGRRHWLVVEKVPGVELWQIGPPEVWASVARWLGRMHARFAPRVGDVRARNPHLLDYGPLLLAVAPQRARSALRAADDPRALDLLRRLVDYDDVIDAIAELPSTFLHGEFYASNVLVSGAGTSGAGPSGVGEEQVEVWPIDWEMAATGPGLLDLAALSEGWDEVVIEDLVCAYLAGLADGGQAPPPIATVVGDLDRCRLHLCLQWIGWASDWQAPSEHARDWTGRALELTERLGL